MTAVEYTAELAKARLAELAREDELARRVTANEELQQGQIYYADGHTAGDQLIRTVEREIGKRVESRHTNLVWSHSIFNAAYGMHYLDGLIDRLSRLLTEAGYKVTYNTRIAQTYSTAGYRYSGHVVELTVDWS
jgi:hypothetical protein